MRCRFLKNVLPTLLFSFLIVQAIHGQYKWSIVGNAVDACGMPVPGAQILVDIADPPGGWIGNRTFTYETSDAEGRFRFTGNASKSGKIEGHLYVIPPFPSNSVVSSNLIPPFYALKLTDPAYGGRPLLFDSSQELNVGDFRVQVNYGRVLVYLRDGKNKPMFIRSKDWEYLHIRIRDIRRRIVNDSYLSPSEVKDSVRLSDSSITFALPDGAWTIEIDPDGPKGQRLASQMFIVKASDSLVELVLKAPPMRK